MDIFIYNSISLIDLGRRVFGQSALSPFQGGIVGAKKIIRL